MSLSINTSSLSLVYSCMSSGVTSCLTSAALGFVVLPSSPWMPLLYSSAWRSGPWLKTFFASSFLPVTSVVVLVSLFDRLGPFGAAVALLCLLAFLFHYLKIHLHLLADIAKVIFSRLLQKLSFDEQDSLLFHLLLSCCFIIVRFENVYGSWVWFILI